MVPPASRTAMSYTEYRGRRAKARSPGRSVSWAHTYSASSAPEVGMIRWAGCPVYSASSARNLL